MTDILSPEPLTADFKWSVVKWSTSRRRFSSQLETLKTRIHSERLDLLIVVDIPRHHAKKLGQQAWVKDYFVSKEARAMTEKRNPEVAGSPPGISVVFSRYPFYSEQWFPLADSTITHVAEVCIPLNAWHPDRSPLSLLQEYQLNYDEVSMLTFVIANHTKDVAGLRETFAASKVRNAVFYVLPPEEADEKTQVNCGTTKLSVDFQQHPAEPEQSLWKIHETGGRYSITMASTLGGSMGLDDNDSE
jgi:hypothetical protein